MSSAGFDGGVDAGVRRTSGRGVVIAWPLRALKIACAALFVCASAGLYAAPQRHVQNGVEYFVGPAGDWVQRTRMSGLAGKPAAVEGPLRYRLLDAQLLLADAAPQRYSHRTIQVLTPAGLERAARVDITYQPQYETLTLHSVAVLRGPNRTEKLSTLRPELMRRELGLEAGLYDGTATASFTLDDVRVGDSIDVEYTLAGINPALGGRYNHVLSLAFPAPLDLYKLRVLADARRPVQLRTVGSSAKVRISQHGRYKQWQVQLDNLAATRPEEHAPPAAAMSPRLEVSEYADWADVAKWADSLYRVPDDLSPELRAAIAELRAGSQDTRQRVRQALRLVQEQVRYVGVEIGEGSYRAAHPSDVFRRRYGDCKDKSVLLAAILRGLGEQARPALVSTWAGRAAQNWMPMPALFDHMIVQVQVDGQTYWLDPTRTHQEGGLDRIGMTPFHWALVTGVAATGLQSVQVPAGYRQGVDTRYEYAVSDYRGPIALKATVTFSGALAEGARGAIAAAGTERLGEELFADVQRMHPGATAVGVPEVRDETEENRLNVTQAFSVPEMFVAQGANLRAQFVAAPIHDLAEPPAKLQRIFPLALPYPFALTTSIDVQLPDDVPMGALSPVRVDDGNLEFTVSRSYAARRLQVRYGVVYKRDAVPAAELAAYARTLREVRTKVAYHLSIANGVELARRRAVESRQLQGRWSVVWWPRWTRVSSESNWLPCKPCPIRSPRAAWKGTSWRRRWWGGRSPTATWSGRRMRSTTSKRPSRPIRRSRSPTSRAARCTPSSADTTRRWRISNRCAGSIQNWRRSRAAAVTRCSCAETSVPPKRISAAPSRPRRVRISCTR